MTDAAASPAKGSSFRAPQLKDVIFSVKLFAAATIALAFGFSEGLENPYWSVLTIYIIVNPPGAGAVRAKAVFRLIGTLLCGVLILFSAATFADQPSFLLAALIGIIVIAVFLHQNDRKPTNYIWFAVAVTAAAVGIAHMSQPRMLFDLAVVRIGEIVFGICVITAIDGIFWPHLMTPEFLSAMTDWRVQVRDWMIDSFKEDTWHANEKRRRAGVRSLAEKVNEIDAQGVQLPLDPSPLAPRSSYLDLLRALVIGLVADFGSIELWLAALRAAGSRRVNLRTSLDAISDWLRGAPIEPGSAIDPHVARGEALIRELDDALEKLDPTLSRIDILERGLLIRLAAFVRLWLDLGVVLRAIETGGHLPARLSSMSRRVSPVRSTDYVASALDVAPIAIAMSVAAFIWYLTAWSAGIDAVIFSFVAGILMLGQKPVAKMVAGSVIAILVAFGLVFLYDFAILPRVTDFVVLMTVLGCALLPLGILMSINPIGMLLIVLPLAMLGLQNAYKGDFEQTVQVMSGGMAGLILGMFCVRVLYYDRARWAARRLSRAVRMDVVDVARGTRPVERHRYLSLAVDRASLFFKSIAELDSAAAVPPEHMMEDLIVGNNLLSLRILECEASPHVQAVIRTLRNEVAHEYEQRPEGSRVRTTLRYVVGSAIADFAVRNDAATGRLLDALTGIQLALEGVQSSSASAEGARG